MENYQYLAFFCQAKATQPNIQYLIGSPDATATKRSR